MTAVLMNGTLGVALTAADVLLESSALSIAMAPADLQLHLPPLGDVGGPSGLSASTLHGVAAMYLQAELEQAGVILAAELLADARFQLDRVSPAAAAKLERFASARREWPNRAARSLVFARLFGLGSVTDAGGVVNHDFMRAFGSLCEAIVRQASAWLPLATDDARVRYAAQAVTLNLAGRQPGSLLPAGQRIGRALREAIDVLGDPGVGTQFGTTGMWETLRHIFAEYAPDFGRMLARGQSGMRLLEWLAPLLVRLGRPFDPPLVARGDPVATPAAQWLAASGLDATPAPAGIQR